VNGYEKSRKNVLGGAITFGRSTGDGMTSLRRKHRGMSWTETGILAVATYAENIKQKSYGAPQLHTSSRTVGKISPKSSKPVEFGSCGHREKIV